MSTLTDYLDQHVRKNTTVEDSMNAVLDHVQARLKDALAGTSLSQETQQRVDAVFDDVQTNKAAVAMAMMTGTAHEGPKWTAPAEPNRSARESVKDSSKGSVVSGR